jgi:hypothetical protein
VLSRFHSLFQACQGAGYFMHSGDYDEVALLTYVGKVPEDVVALVTAHRDRFRADMKPRPDAEQAFDLACGTAVLELAARNESVAGVRDAHSMASLQAILAAQQAAATSAMLSATASS